MSGIDVYPSTKELLKSSYVDTFYINAGYLDMSDLHLFTFNRSDMNSDDDNITYKIKSSFVHKSRDNVIGYKTQMRKMFNDKVTIEKSIQLEVNNPNDINKNETYAVYKLKNEKISIIIITNNKNRVEDILNKYGFKYVVKGAHIVINKINQLDYKVLANIFMRIGFIYDNEDRNINYIGAFESIYKHSKHHINPSDMKVIINKYQKFAIDNIFNVLIKIMNNEEMINTYMEYPDLYHEIYNQGSDILEKEDYYDLVLATIEKINYYLAMVLFAYPKTEETNKKILKHLFSAGDSRDITTLRENLLWGILGLKVGENLGFDLDFSIDTIINLVYTLSKSMEKIKMLEKELDESKK